MPQRCRHGTSCDARLHRPSLHPAPSHGPETREPALELAGVLLIGGPLVALGMYGERLLDRVLVSGVSVLEVALVLAAANVVAIGALMLASGLGTVRTLADPRRRRALGLQWLLVNLMAPVAIFSLLTDDARVRPALEDGGLAIALPVAAYALAFVAWRLWRRSQRHDAPSADEAMAADPRAPVLYLRSFADDGQVLSPMHSAYGMAWLPRLLLLSTPEQQLAAALNALGPVIAIGKPGEPLPELGAARLYVAHDQWQAKVQELMRGAALVVLRVGASPGLLWEIDQALANVPRSRVVFALVGDAALAEPVAQRLEGVLGDQAGHAAPAPLAPLRGWRRWLLPPSEWRLGALVCFPRGGAAKVVAMRYGTGWRGLRVGTFVPALAPQRFAWRNVFALLGDDLPGACHARTRRSRMLAILLALLFGWAGAHWFYLGQKRRGWIYLALLPMAAASVFAAFYDAGRFLWLDRADFDRLVQGRATSP